jgi:phage terminase large subunit-like protein
MKTRKKPAVRQSREQTTAAWVRNRADELAVEAGCWFDPLAGGFSVWWIERYCRLYEGEQAGEPMILHGCHECDYGLGVPDQWDEEAQEIAVERARRHVECLKRGHACDWQYDVTMRLFGWRKQSERWGRPVRRFRKASIWVPKKSKKSPTASGWGLYLTCADGEQGQKVYVAAKDGQQAREIIGKHALEMVQASDALSAECQINKALLQITHLPTRSLMKPISSADSKTQKAKEGLNGSVIIDEIHVADRDLLARISRAGISRSEPLHIEVSTAGDDPESYGKERYDTGKLVNENGGDESLLFVCYEAPQDLADKDLDDDPVKWGKLANPAWGHTINEEEFLSDYNTSKVSLSELGLFKKYRLNIWQQAANPWLRKGDWARCKRTYWEGDLIGLPCHAGLDLAKTRDLTCFVLIFRREVFAKGQPRTPETKPEAHYYLLPYFFLPEQRARDLSGKVPYLQWAKEGHLILTPGEVCDYGIVRAEFRRVCERFKVGDLAYDPWNAEETTQQMEQGVQEGGKLEEGTYVKRVMFRQGWISFAGPSEEFERLVISDRLHHNGNKVLTWQANHVAVAADVNGNKRPVKPSYPSKVEDYRTIDGIVGSVMALARELINPAVGSWYDSGGVEFFG